MKNNSFAKTEKSGIFFSGSFSVEETTFSLNLNYKETLQAK